MPKKLLNSNFRRALLENIASGGGICVALTLPKTCSTPVVAAVVLPGHAETTCDETLKPTALIIPGTVIKVCKDVFDRPQHELYTFYNLGHVCGQLQIVDSFNSFGKLELSPDRAAVGLNQIMVYRRRLLELSRAPAQVTVFTALGVSSAIRIGCDDASVERIAGIQSEDEVPLEVDGQPYSVKVTIQANADPLQLILADLVVH